MVLAQPDLERPTTVRASGTKNVHRQGGHRGLYRKEQDTPSGVINEGALLPQNNRLSGL